jgi:hypothetical protein
LDIKKSGKLNELPSSFNQKLVKSTITPESNEAPNKYND